MKKVWILMLVTVGLWGNPAYSVEYDNYQREVLLIAWKAGAAIGYPETIQAICIQETLAGLLGPIGDLGEKVGKKSYGVMQVKLETAKDVLRWYPSEFQFTSQRIIDEELMIKLILDDEFNIKVGSLYFKKLIERSKRYKKPWSKAVLAYNQGFNGTRNPNDYIRKVQINVKRIRLFNQTM